MRVDAGWQQLLPLLRSFGEPAVGEIKPGGSGSTAAAGQTPAGAFQVNISGTAMIQQLLSLAENLMAGADWLPADTPAVIKEQVSGLLTQAAIAADKLPSGLAPLVNEQRSVPQRLNALAEEIRLAKTLVETALGSNQAQPLAADEPTPGTMLFRALAAAAADPPPASLAGEPPLAPSGAPQKPMATGASPAKQAVLTPAAEPASDAHRAERALAGNSPHTPVAADLPAPATTPPTGGAPSPSLASAARSGDAGPPSLGNAADASVAPAPAKPVVQAANTTLEPQPLPEPQTSARLPQALQRFILELVTLDQGPAAPAAGPDEPMSADQQRAQLAGLRLQAAGEEQAALARYVGKLITELKQAFTERGLPAAEAETQAWRELALAGSLLQHDPAKLQEWSGAVKELANAWARLVQGGAEPAGGRELQVSWMMPFLDPEQGKVRPALIQVYRDRPEEPEASGRLAETWLRVTTETDHAGLVVAGFHQQGERLSVRVSVEKEDGAALFRELLPDIRLRLQEVWPESGVDVL